MPRDVEALVDQVAAATGRTRRTQVTSTQLTAAIAGRRRAETVLAGRDPLASDRRSFRILYYLLYLMLAIGVYTGLISLGWQRAADYTLESMIVLGAVLAWFEHRHSQARAVDDPDDGDEVPVHIGFSDEPAELAEQLAELHPAAEPDAVPSDLAPGVMPAMPTGPPMYAYVCARCGFDPLVDALDPPVPLCGKCGRRSVSSPGTVNGDGKPSTAAVFCAPCIDGCHDSEIADHWCPVDSYGTRGVVSWGRDVLTDVERREIAADALAERTADAMDGGRR